MNDLIPRRYIVYSVVTIASIILLEELVYYWWRELNPGSHWSHLRGEYIPIIEYPPPPRSNGTLNNQWRQW